MASGEAKIASRRKRLGVAVLREVGTSADAIRDSNERAVLFAPFSVGFHYN
jgi:hypothetical protein